VRVKGFAPVRSRRAPSETGSVLALVPAGFLVLVLLGAIAVDSAESYLAQQQLHDALSAAANDAATAGLDNAAFYGSGALVLNPRRVAQTVCLDLVAQDDPALHSVRVWMSVDGNAVDLSGSAQIDAIFGRALPGFGRHTVRSSASAVVTEGPPTPGPTGAVSPPLAESAGGRPLVPLNCSQA
jgi:hypothetical protein